MVPPFFVIALQQTTSQAKHFRPFDNEYSVQLHPFAPTRKPFRTTLGGDVGKGDNTGFQQPGSLEKSNPFPFTSSSILRYSFI